MKVSVGVFYGGRSVEHEVSIISALQVMHAIDKDKYRVVPFYITKKGIWYTGEALFDLDNYRDMEKLLAKCQKVNVSQHTGEHAFSLPAKGLFQKTGQEKIDVAFPVMHGTHGEDGTLQGMFELMGIAYVGCDVLSSAIGMDKIAMKALFSSAGLPIVNYVWFHSKEWLNEKDAVIKRIEDKLNYPVIVKPANLGSSVGISKAENVVELEDAVDLAKSFANRILVEQMVTDLREINCAVLGDYEEVFASVCEEPVSSKDVLTFQDKYMSGGKAKGMSGASRIIPAPIPDDTKNLIQKMAKDAFQALNCSGVSRLDFLLDTKHNKVYVNEINTIPGSLSFYLWEPTGKSFTELTSDLIRLAFKRHRETEQLIFSYDSNILSMKSLGGTKHKK